MKEKDAQELRRSARFEVLIPVEVAWLIPSGQKVTERAEVVEANQHGGLLVMRTYPPLGQPLELANLLSGEKVGARAVAFRQSVEAGVQGLAVELDRPSETFWGITYRLRRASSELKNLEEAMKSSTGLDLRVLQEFRDAVDYVRKTAWVVYEWQERQLHQRDTATVMPLLTSERLRRATQLSYAILQDLATLPPERYPGEVANFFEVVALVYRRLAPHAGFQPPPSPKVD